MSAVQVSGVTRHHASTHHFQVRCPRGDVQGHSEEGVLRHGLPQPRHHLPLHPDSQAQLRGELRPQDTQSQPTGKWKQGNK